MPRARSRTSCRSAGWQPGVLPGLEPPAARIRHRAARRGAAHRAHRRREEQQHRREPLPRRHRAGRRPARPQPQREPGRRFRPVPHGDEYRLHRHELAEQQRLQRRGLERVGHQYHARRRQHHSRHPGRDRGRRRPPVVLQPGRHVGVCPPHRQWAWANIAGLGWRRVNGGAADGVSNMFVSLCNAAANGRLVHVEADGQVLYTMYLV